MEITVHAAKRFAERVLGENIDNGRELARAYSLLSNLLANVVAGNYRRPIALPEFKGFKVIHEGNRAITILPKEWIEHRGKKRKKSFVDNDEFYGNYAA